MAVWLLFCTGCVYYPKQLEVYDSECRVHYKKYVLQGTQVGEVECYDEACFTALIPAAVSAIVAGSVVVSGNVFFWLEKESRCLKAEGGELSTELFY